MTTSPISWVGGKHRLRRHIIARLPADAECYVEAFAGAAWVLFGMPPHPVEVLNDADGDLVNLWRVLKWRPAELLEQVQQYLYSREWLLELRANKPSGSNEMARAVWTYLMIQMSFGSDISRPAAAAFGCRKRARGSQFLLKSREQVGPAADRLANVLVERLDCVDLIRRYDGERTLFYCDPPYLGTSGYAIGFTLADHERLCAALKGIAGRFLLTVNDHPLLRELYSGFRIKEATEPRALSRTSTGRKAASILFIANYDAVTVAR